jgi:hypothetical protein
VNKLLAERIDHERELRVAEKSAFDHERELRAIFDQHERELRLVNEAAVEKAGLVAGLFTAVVAIVAGVAK